MARRKPSTRDRGETMPCHTETWKLERAEAAGMKIRDKIAGAMTANFAHSVDHLTVAFFLAAGIWIEIPKITGSKDITIPGRVIGM